MLKGIGLLLFGIGLGLCLLNLLRNIKKTKILKIY